ncbi:mechanosensitive ion channel [Halomonas desiderata]|uniref:Mechanosensitive ion channel n=1 Tax=Billgrantia desiderata TaxID=52021 RepID=A0AAW4YWZ2_9GAMM|nr:mechanosensitive ion channel [Halomonas desiderata]NIC36881.1 mechanosensitive ion channel [Halomonas desiderata]
MIAQRILACLLVWLSIALLASSPALAQPADTGAAPAPEVLAELLENEQTRQQLIEHLRRQAAADPALAAEPDGAISLPRQLAEMTSRVVSDIGGEVRNLFAVVAGLFTAETDTAAIDWGGFLTAAINLGLVIAATFALFLFFRRLSRPLFTRLSQWSKQGGGLNPIILLVLCVLIAAVIDVLVVALSYVGGNLIATFAVGETGELSTRASLFLNAFLIIELIKAAIRMLFASRYEGLRLLPISAAEASYWNRWLARLIGLVGYGLLVVAPLTSVYLAPTMGQAVGALIMFGAFIYAVAVVLKNRLRIRDELNAMAARSDFTATRISLQLFARTWHLFALAYFLMVLVLTLTRPADALPFVLMATLKTVVVVVVGMLLSSLLTHSIGRRIRLSDDMRRKLPLLEPRLNSYVPNALRVIRTVILAAVVLLVLDAWGAFDLAAWYASEPGRGLVGTLVSVAVILLLAIGVWLGLASLIEHKLNPETGTGEPDARAKTLLTLFRNALAIALITMTAMIVLSEIGINIGPLIAGAGVLGLAIGFGAQKLVQDIITGIFIQVENAMNTGDVVSVGGITGTAERLSIRSVGIRDLSGTYHIVPFSSVDTVSNFMREFGYHVGEYGIAYRESIDEAIVALREAFDELAADETHKMNIVAPLEVAGVTALANSSVNIRVRIKTTPGTQWGIGRAYNRLVKLHFDAKGIEIPFPHTTLYFGVGKEGEAPPANVRLMQQNFDIDGRPGGQPRSGESSREGEDDPRSRPNPEFKGDYEEKD